MSTYNERMNRWIRSKAGHPRVKAQSKKPAVNPIRELIERKQTERIPRFRQRPKAKGVKP